MQKMIIDTVSKEIFEIRTDGNILVGSIRYKDNSFREATLHLDQNFTLLLLSPGVWVTRLKTSQREKIAATVKTASGGILSVRRFNKKGKYIFKKPTNWKSRFALLNSSGDELLALMPTVNWKKESHDYILQLNEEFTTECDSFLILQALHCANCSLSMMTGGEVPALISI
jgi:hypothetical protein